MFRFALRRNVCARRARVDDSLYYDSFDINVTTHNHNDCSETYLEKAGLNQQKITSVHFLRIFSSTIVVPYLYT